MIKPENKNDKLWILLIINSKTSSDAQIYIFSALCFADWFHIIYMY